MKVFIILALCVVASFAAPGCFGGDSVELKLKSKDKEILILKYDLTSDNAGNYKLNVLGKDGTNSFEHGVLKDLKSAEEPVATKSGNFSYIATDGKVYAITYFADETGYHAVGDHLPVAPTITEEIQKSLLLPRDPNPDGPLEENEFTPAIPGYAVRDEPYKAID